MFYTFTNLQGSQTYLQTRSHPHAFYTFTNLQGSQTEVIARLQISVFYTFTNLQGSQTSKSSSEVITEPSHLACEASYSHCIKHLSLSIIQYFSVERQLL